MRLPSSPTASYLRGSARPPVSALAVFRDRWCGRSFRAVAILAFLAALTGCATLRGRADDALARRDYSSAVDLYAQVVARNPNDASARVQLTRAERGWFDDTMARFDSEQSGQRKEAALQASLSVFKVKDRVSDGALDADRKARFQTMVEWIARELRDSIHAETARDRALAARERRNAFAPWLGRPELATLKPELDGDIANAAVRTCASSTRAAGDSPFALELVAAYCKEWGAPLPAWKPRPYLLGGLRVTGTIAGTPAEEIVQLQSALAGGFERSVWFSVTARPALGAATIEGAVSAALTLQQAELTRGWSESVPYESTETYSVPIEVPYTTTETYNEQVPYTAYEGRAEPCPPPRKGTCTVTHPVTRMRNVTKYRNVTRTRTEWEQRTRPVTRYRDEPRVFRYVAQKHDGVYHASAYLEVTLPEITGAVVVRDVKDDRRSAYEHDVAFAPAGVSPERANLPSALAWREDQRVRLATMLVASLDAKWVSSFCGAGVSSIEEAARCAHARPAAVPPAVSSQLAALFTDDVELVVALPRPKEGA